MTMHTYIFFKEGCEYDPTFEIEADTSDEAFDLAYEQYGPQVEDLFYKQKHL